MIGRILILDDEPLALDGLKRVLRPLAADWELLFASDARQALDWMSDRPVDLVLSDLLMPGMKGIEFLGRVRDQYPQTVRLILSGYIDRELLLRCATSAHRAVAKPCNPADLLAVLRRALSVITSIPTHTLRTAICRTDRLPTQPEIRRQLICSGDLSLDRASACVARDVGLAAIVLKLANSPVVQVAKQICSIPDAVACLGLDTVRSLAASATEPAWSAFTPDRLQKLWKHSLDTAMGAQLIARIEHVHQEILDEAFAAGLLHDAGKFLLVSNFPDQYSEAVRLAIEEKIELSEAEVRIFGAAHPKVGAALLDLWGLPASMLETVSMHHLPSGTCCHRFSALTAVHVANALIHERDDDSDCSPVSHVDPAHIGDLGLSARINTWRGAISDGTSKMENGKWPVPPSRP